ncbi:hypothetical protein ACVIM8_005729 [Bradyrhizobium sp. USDA 4529]
MAGNPNPIDTTILDGVAVAKNGMRGFVIEIV